LVNAQIKRGQKWDKIHAVVSIIISEHALTDEEEYLNYYELNNVKSGKVFTDLLNLVIINLDKVPGEDDGRAVWPWLKFMKSRGGENLEHLGRRNEELDMAISMLNVLKLPGYLHEMAEYREIRRRDEAARESYLIRTSREKGLEEGREETVRKMKLKGYPLDEIADITGFSPDQIARL
ncbi:MAG: Rpn family recombination-promoting nuclease/putative transposase, partial [Treponema sp.]|nr:Rpn family recombination-promoting nuclease/putative transposase [Treponema sp.]